MSFDLNKFLYTVKVVSRDKPGQRFTNYHRNRRVKVEPPWRSAAYIGLGVLLFIAGLTLGLLPVMPAILFVIPGLILIVSRMQAAARLSDRIEVDLRRTLRQFWRGY